MPELSQSEILRRVNMVQQELRVAYGGPALKEQLKQQIRDLHKSQLAVNPPSAENLQRVMMALTSQLRLIDDETRRKELENYTHRAQDLLHGSTHTQEVMGGKPSKLFSDKQFPANKNIAPTHINFPLLPQLSRDEGEIFFELAAILSEMDMNYQPAVFVEVFLAAIQKYDEKYGTIDGFIDKTYQICIQQRPLLKDIFALFSTDAMLDLSQKLLANQSHKE